MKVNEYLIVSEAVEDGVAHGWHRVHKHNDAPSPEQIKQEIHECVMSALCEYFIFDNLNDD